MIEKINYQQASFFKSCAQMSDCPPDIGVEVAFAGRSNVGKSSVINTLVQQTKLARTSKTPGRTQLLNYFGVAPDKYIVDLPGYGYAKVPTRIQEQWQKVLSDYFSNRTSLVGIVLIMDIRHPMKPDDETMLSFAEYQNLPVHIVLNKADKLKRGPAQNTLLQMRKQFNPDFVSIQLFSALKKTGIDALREKLNDWYLNP